MSQKDTILSFCPASRKDWRQWLRKNHKSCESVWLELYKKDTGMPTITWKDAVSEALCFGWIDGKRLSISDEKFTQFFCKRKPKSTWSKINKENVKALIESRLMTKTGYEAVSVSKANGSWDGLNNGESLTIPKDLEIEVKKTPGPEKQFCPYRSQKENCCSRSSCLQNDRNHERRECVRSFVPCKVMEIVDNDGGDAVHIFSSIREF